MSVTEGLKVVLLGTKDVGKTSIFNRAIYSDFTKTSMTIGAYFAMKTMKLRDEVHSLAVWDTAGEEKFQSLTTFYYRNAKAALVTYDLTNRQSFTSLPKWVDRLQQQAGKSCVLLFLGNKLDIVLADPNLRQVEFGEAKRFAAQYGGEVIECSAKDGRGVEVAFDNIVTRMVNQGRPKQPNSSTKFDEDHSLNLTEPNKPSWRCCHSS